LADVVCIAGRYWRPSDELGWRPSSSVTGATDKWTEPGIDENFPVLIVMSVEEVWVTDSVTNTVTIDPVTPWPRNG